MREVIGSLVLLAIVIIVGLVLGSMECSSKWRVSGFQTDWGPVQGCLISKDGKTWIPAENYRDIP